MPWVSVPVEGPRLAFDKPVRFPEFWLRVKRPARRVLMPVDYGYVFDSLWTNAAQELGPVAWWQFNEEIDPSDPYGAGDKAFESIEDLDGDYVDVEIEQPSPLGDKGAIKLNGGHVILPPSDAFRLGEFTVAFWLKPADIGPRDLIFYNVAEGGRGGFSIRGEDDKIVVEFKEVSLGSSSIESSSGLLTEDGDWLHFALTYRDGEAAIFINGQEDVRDEVSYDPRIDEGATWIGAEDIAFPWNRFTGWLDELMIFDRALDAGDLFTLLVSVIPGDLVDFGAPDVVLRPGEAWGTVQVQSGEDWSADTPVQDVIDAQSEGTVFELTGGTYYGWEAQPKANMRFFGTPGGNVVLDGSIDLMQTARLREGSLYAFLDRTEPLVLYDDYGVGETHPGRERDTHRYDLWWDGKLLRHMPTTNLQPGEWHFDYDADKVFVAENPAGHDVRLSVARYAFVDAGWNGPNVPFTVQNMTIRRYAMRAQHGAIYAEASSVTLQHVHCTENHGGGAKLGAGSVVEHSRFSYNGQLGIGVVGYWNGGVTIRDTRIDHNKTLGYDEGWEGGAMKITTTIDGVMDNCWVDHNYAFGIWWDIDNFNATTTRCLTEHNHNHGIFYEIGFGGEISNNICRHNGWESFGDQGCGIFISNNSDTLVERNVIVNNRAPIIWAQGERGFCERPGYSTLERLTINNTFQYNEVCFTPYSVASGLRIYNGKDTEDVWETNVWDYNLNRAEEEDPRPFYMFGAPDRFDFDTWQQEYGFDLNGSIQLGLIEPTFELMEDRFRKAWYGPV